MSFQQNKMDLEDELLLNQTKVKKKSTSHALDPLDKGSFKHMIGEDQKNNQRKSVNIQS